MTENSLDVPPSPMAWTKRGRWPRAFLAAIGLFLLGERLVWRDPRVLGFVARYKSPTRVGDPFIPSTAALFSMPAEPPPVILLGSSQVREGLDCGVFETLLPGRHCRNMAVSAGTPLDVLYIDRALDSAGSRRITVAGLFPGMFHTEPKRSFIDLDTVRCLVSGGSWARLTADDWTGLAFGLLASASPTLRHKDALWDVLRRVGDDFESAWRGALPPTPERVLADRDPLPARYFLDRLGRVNPEIAPSRFTPAHDLALERLIARERARGNRVFIVDFPTRPGYETTITPEAAAHYRALVARLAGRSDVAFVSSSDLPPLDVEDFHDFTHLAESGRRKVSERLAALLARQEPGAEPPAAPGR